ncbi:MAG: NAD(P)H-hydrate dehydratase [Candidatus Izemoplasma sp.]|nr:NAD(P)H-hydrate dehydratase [Candidatus Izemoplasma sp.]
MNQPIVDTARIRKFDQLTIEKENITSLELMRRVGGIMADYMINNSLITQLDHIVVISGCGNNGGDALVIAKHLLAHDYRVDIFLIGEKDTLSDETMSLVKELKKDITFLHKTVNFDPLMTVLQDTSILIDGIFGIGLSRDVEGIYKDIIELIQRYDNHIISIDMPSGIHADNGLIQGVAVKANDTLIVQTLKQGNVLNEGIVYTGRRHVLDVGILADYREEETHLLDPNYYRRYLKPRQALSHKYDYGHVLTVGGSKGMMGAPMLSAQASMRCGSGLVSVLYLDTDQNFIPSYIPELMVDMYSGLASFTPKLEKKDAVVFGMGLKQDNAIRKESLNQLLKTDIPVVIDAAGLTYFKALKDQHAERGNIVITPHKGEFAKFLNISIDELNQNLILYAKNVAHKYHTTVVLKGPVTIITNDTLTYFSHFANPGMATAGSGDVLAGMIGSFLGQGYSPIEAAVLGVSIHSHAGNIAKDTYGETSMLATDIVESIAKVLKD